MGENMGNDDEDLDQADHCHALDPNACAVQKSRGCLWKGSVSLMGNGECYLGPTSAPVPAPEPQIQVVQDPCPGVTTKAECMGSARCRWNTDGNKCETHAAGYETRKIGEEDNSTSASASAYVEVPAWALVGGSCITAVAAGYLLGEAKSTCFGRPAKTVPQ